MSSTFHKLQFHLVFETLGRRPLLPLAVRQELFRYMGGIMRGLGGRLLGAGGVDDHVHLVPAIPPSVSVADVVCKLKAKSSAWLKRTYPHLRGFAWKPGYAAFSISPSKLEDVKQYARTQEQHHAASTFREEMNELCRLSCATSSGEAGE